MRLLNTGEHTGAWNMALDEAMMQSTRETGVSSLRFFSWKPSAITIGYFQNLEQEVDVENCKKLGIDIVRRQTGGGAVFHESELTYSFITKEYSQDIVESYKLICGALVDGLKTIGIDGQFVPINDLITNGKKFSGNAQTRKEKVLLQHGTILLKVDVEKMFSLLKVPDEKIRDKMISTVKERVIGIDKGFDEVADAIKIGFKNTFNVEFEESKPTEKELETTEELIKSKYGNLEWTNKA